MSDKLIYLLDAATTSSTNSGKSELGKELTSKFEKLFPSIPMMIATLIALTLVIIIL
ncbi:UNVERIFIED_CONTAM: hypothetical protein O8I53_08160 [Campylobacter lari]